MKDKKSIEVLAPAGNFEMLSAAVNAGADAVYLGVKGLNMRASARNFSSAELKKAVNYCHKNKVKVYVTLNTIIYEDEINTIKKILDAVKAAKADAVIAWDFSVIKLARERNIEVHLSTQASVSNSLALEEYKKSGIKRVVLARECTVDEIKNLAKKTDIGIEVFCHGAMCVSESGRCFMSQFQYNKSANRGECLQPCRRKYIITDDETGEQLAVEGRYVLSPKDLCTVHFIDKLVGAGVTSLKIEGRARSPEYVAATVKAYKEAVKLAVEKKLTYEKKKELTEKLREVFNRGFSGGFYMGRPITDFWNEYGGKAKYRKDFLGRIINYYPKAGVFHAKINSGALKAGDRLLITGPTTGVIELEACSIWDDKGCEMKSAKKGDNFTCKIDYLVRKNDNIYRKIKSKDD